MTETKTFSLGQVLTITHGRMLCPVGEIYEILNWMTGESLMTHQLPRASRESEGFLLEQFPALAEIDVSDVPIKTEGDALKYVSSLAVSYGSQFEVKPLPTRDHTHIDPIAEIKMMRPDLPIIQVGLTD